jgi:uncharacterized protein (DUF983 family)
MDENSVATGIRRGLACRCPVRGKDRLFSGYLRITTRCEHCGAGNRPVPSDELPPYPTILPVGQLLVPSVLWLDRVRTLDARVEFAIWLPLAALMSILLPPRMTGVSVRLCRATGLVRQV